MTTPLRALTVALMVAALTTPASLAQAIERIERGTLIIEGIPEIPDRVTQRLQQYQNIRSASLQGWHPSGEGMLIGTRFGETTQIHWVKAPGGARHQLTFFDEPVNGASVSPSTETNGFVFSKDVGGSEFYQLFFFDFDSGEYQMLTDGTSRNQGAIWSNDGKRFVFTTTRRNGRDWDLHLQTAETSAPSQPILEEGGLWFSSDWSPDDSKLLVARYVSVSEIHPFVLDTKTGDLSPFRPIEEKVAYGPAFYAKDGKGIYYTSDEGSEFQSLRFHDVESGATTVLTPDIPWEVESLALSEDGRYLAFTVNEEGISRLYLRDLSTGDQQDVPQIPMGVVYGLEFSPDNRKLGLVLNTPKSPGDIYALDLETMELGRWTFSEVGGLNSEEFVVPELIHFPTFDQVDGKPRSIPAFYYRPTGEGPFPVLIDIHGGPEGQERPTFSSSLQYAVKELGIAVLAPNVRGSTGYGKSYVKLDNGFLREDSVKDIGKLLDWIETRPELDADRVGVTGGSYGGYMVLASMVHYNDRLRAGIDIVGISNFVTFLENTQDYRRDYRRVEYGDERDPDMRAFLEKISPNRHAGKITKPLLVVQGRNDPRVPVTESEQMVQAIREAGGTVWYLEATDEGHGFRKKGNRDYYTAAVALFLEKFFLGEEPADAG